LRRARVKLARVPVTERPLLAIAIRIGATLCVASLMALVKLASARGISLPELLFWRQAITIPVILGALTMGGQLYRLRTRRLKSHALRALISCLGMTSVFTASILLTLPQASVLTFTSPFFAVLVTALIVRETVGPWRWSAVLVGFCGVLLIAQPGGEHLDPLGVAAGLTAALVVVVISYQVKDLALTDDPLAIVFYLALFASLYLAVLLPFFARPRSADEWLLLAGIGALGGFGQYLMTVSLKYGAITTVLIMDYALLLWTTLLSVVIWSDLPPRATWIGAPLIIAAGLIITWREHRLSRRPPSVSIGPAD
jgi:drug/metabolite transporter (DMT)-like permease